MNINFIIYTQVSSFRNHSGNLIQTRLGIANKINPTPKTTRSGFTSSDLGLEDTSESFGLPATADFMFALISNEEMEELGQILVKQLKNRYNDPTMNKRFVIGIDRSKMLLYDVQIKEQDDLVDSGQEPVFDKTSFGTKFKDSKYEDFKV